MNKELDKLGFSKMKSKGKIIGTTGNRMFYEEKAPQSSIIQLIMTAVFLALAFSYGFVVFGHFFGFEKAPDEVQFVLLLTILVIAFAMWSFFSMRFRITGNGVEAIMPPINYRVQFTEIKEVKMIKKIPWYVGWGLRLWGRKLAFVSRHKRAVVIEKENGFFRALLLTPEDPDEFVKMVQERMNQKVS